MRTFKVELDTAYADKAIKETGLLQGNQNFAFEFRLAERGEPITIDNMKKPKLIFNFENGVESFTVDESSPDYPVTVAGNVVKVAASKYLSMGYGRVKLMIKIDDYYTYSCIYYVDRNENFAAPPVAQSDAGDFALKDFKNVSNDVFRQKYKEAVKEPMSDADFLTQAKKNGLAENDLADVDLQKLYDKGIDSGLMSKDGSNFSPSDFDRELKANAAFRALQNADHPAISGKTDEEIKKLFYANRYEVQAAIDLSQLPYKDATTLYLAFQLTSDGQKITQILPLHSDGKIIMVELIFSTGVSSGSLEIDAASGESIDGIVSASSMTFTKQGYLGYFLPFKNEPGYDFISHHETHDYSMQFMDGLKNEWFTSQNIQSIDKTVRIAKLGENADFSVEGVKGHDGILAFVGNDQLYNTKYDKAKIYFGDVRVQGGAFVYQNLQNKSFVIQDINMQDDSNMSEGTTFLVALSYVPSAYELAPLTQDGKIMLEFVDNNESPILDINGNPMGVEVEYKTDDVQRKELYVGECRVKDYTEVHLKLKTTFANEEILSIGADTCIMLQAISKKESAGMALLAFMAFTGYRIGFDNIYYGTNSLNFAQYLTFDMAEQEVAPITMYLGDDTYLDFKTKVKAAIQNYQLIIKDNGTDLPVFSIVKRYSKFATHYIGGKEYNTTVKITDKNNAFQINLMKYTGIQNPAPLPSVQSYDNGSPVFSADWEAVDSLFISEDAVSGIHTAIKKFNLPSDGKELAIVLYPVSSQIPTTLKLNDFEGDIVPGFNKLVITTNSHIKEQYLEFSKEYYKAKVDTPKGDASYRYTVNDSSTKIPAGVIAGGDGKIVNDNSWSDAGSSDPLKVQGDFKFLVDGNVNMEYQAQIFNETGTINNVEIWLAKVGPGPNQLTEVPNSKFATTIEANRMKPKKVYSKSFSFSAKANETYRVLAKSNVADGFYLQSGTDGVPLFAASIVFDETNGRPAAMDNAPVIQVMEDGKPIAGKTIQIDSKTGAITIK